MFDPAAFWRFYGPFSPEPMIPGNLDQLPNEDVYPGNLPVSALLSLYPMPSLRPFDFNTIIANINRILFLVNNLQGQNFKIYGKNPITASLFKGTDGTAIVTQDEITVLPNKDALASKNLIPRIDENGFFPMPNTSNAETAKGKIGTGSTYFKVKKDRGQIVFVPDGTERVWVTGIGWAEADPGATVAATDGFAIDFDPDKSIWILFVDNDKVAFVDGNGIVDNFVNTEPGVDTINKTVEAFIDFNTTDSTIEFFCQTEADTAIKRTGFIDSTGFNDG